MAMNLEERLKFLESLETRRTINVCRKPREGLTTSPVDRGKELVVNTSVPVDASNDGFKGPPVQAIPNFSTARPFRLCIVYLRTL